jgi:hypothetical protein
MNRLLRSSFLVVCSYACSSTAKGCLEVLRFESLKENEIIPAAHYNGHYINPLKWPNFLRDLANERNQYYHFYKEQLSAIRDFFKQPDISQGVFIDNKKKLCDMFYETVTLHQLHLTLFRSTQNEHEFYLFDRLLANYGYVLSEYATRRAFGTFDIIPGVPKWEGEIEVPEK